MKRSDLLGALARGYCKPGNIHKQLDSDLIMAMADEVEAMLAAAPSNRNEDGQYLKGWLVARGEAAKVCDRLEEAWHDSDDESSGHWMDAASKVSTAIRALKQPAEQEPTATAKSDTESTIAHSVADSGASSAAAIPGKSAEQALADQPCADSRVMLSAELIEGWRDQWQRSSISSNAFHAICDQAIAAIDLQAEVERLKKDLEEARSVFKSGMGKPILS